MEGLDNNAESAEWNARPTTPKARNGTFRPTAPKARNGTFRQQRRKRGTNSAKGAEYYSQGQARSASPLVKHANSKVEA